MTDLLAGTVADKEKMVDERLVGGLRDHGYREPLQKAPGESRLARKDRLFGLHEVLGKGWLKALD